jgi:hypothetical protein
MQAMATDKSPTWVALLLVAVALGLAVWLEAPASLAPPAQPVQREAAFNVKPPAPPEPSVPSVPPVEEAKHNPEPPAPSLEIARPASASASASASTATKETAPPFAATVAVDPMAIFEVFERHSFDWETSSTPTPITKVTNVAKKMLGYKPEDLPAGLRALLPESEGVEDSYRHTVPVAAARKFLVPHILADLDALCTAPARCDFNAQDPEFKTTPLHWAEWYGEPSLVQFLLERGADPSIVDAVGRKPANMTFASFITNSRQHARTVHRACEIPEVVLPLTSEGATEAAIKHAESEVRRLVSEGEPVLIRNVVPWLKARMGLEPRVASAQDFISEWGNLQVKVAGIPYADNFNVSSTPMSLRAYFDAHMAAQAKPAAGEEQGINEDPLYVFRGDSEACAEGERLMSAFINSVFPVTGTQGLPLICRTDSPGLGVSNVQFYLGRRGSGAPFHIHSDAANIMLSGSKQWWILPPKNATFSRMHIRQWVDGVLPALEKEDVPLGCVQWAGDMMYVPFDWGHAAMNLQDGSFGYTTELVNRRDTLMFAKGRPCGTTGSADAPKQPKRVTLRADMLAHERS